MLETAERSGKENKSLHQQMPKENTQDQMDKCYFKRKPQTNIKSGRYHEGNSKEKMEMD